MKKIRMVVAVLMLTLGVAAVAHADLNSTLHKINEQAKADLNTFRNMLSAQFALPLIQIDAIIKKLPTPSDAFMVLQLGQMANKPHETVINTYQSNRNKGWGVIAQELGIKPGSPEFHALKRGDVSLTGQPGGGSNQGHGNGKGKGHGHGKGHGRD